MRNRVLVELVVPKVEKSYNVYLPVNKTLGNIIILLNKSLTEINGVPISDEYGILYNKATGQMYDSSVLLSKTDIRNGTVIILV